MIIGVLNIKGGVGKTTTSMALSTAIYRSGKDVTIFDTDPQGSATLWSQAAEDNGDALPFEVLSKNQAEIRRLGSHRPDKDGQVIVIDTPPSGDVINEVIKVSDFVIIPSTSSPVDLQQTLLTCASCQDQGKEYAVLIVMARKGTTTLEAFRTAVEKSGAGIFDAEIPLKEVFKGDFGHSFPSNLQGYEDVWKEIREVEA
ncbi:AAA family ATPase [Bifidobacterium sp.]|uniref:AAA family ATPase n=1 Tax=Bifidobacterium sp. TaxID=41200 RepID=UPI003D7C885C